MFQYTFALDFKKQKKQKGKGRPLGKCTRIIISTPKQMLQILLIPLEQAKADNTSENILNEIICFLTLYVICIEQRKLLKKYIII